MGEGRGGWRRELDGGGKEWRGGVGGRGGERDGLGKKRQHGQLTRLEHQRCKWAESTTMGED